MHSWKILTLAAVLACVAAAQTEPAKAPSQTEKKAATAAPAEKPTDPVITIQNLCLEPKPGAECKTVITRGEFDRIMKAVRPNLPPGARMQIAEKYVQLLAFADKAQQQGLDKSPEFQEQLELLRIQALAVAFTRHLQENAKPSDAEVEKYYLENKPAYEEVTLKRIYIPKPSADGEKKPPLDEAATKALAEKIQARAVAGEDFDKLQQEGFAAANPDAPKNSAPPTAVGPRRRGQLPASQESKIFDLKPGQVSPLMEEPSGYFIYKVETKQVLPLDKLKPQIARQLEEQKMRDAMAQITSAAKPAYDESYFKVPPEPEGNPMMPGGEAPEHPAHRPPAPGPSPSTHPR